MLTHEALHNIFDLVVRVQHVDVVIHLLLTEVTKTKQRAQQKQEKKVSVRQQRRSGLRRDPCVCACALGPLGELLQLVVDGSQLRAQLSIHIALRCSATGERTADMMRSAREKGQSVGRPLPAHRGYLPPHPHSCIGREHPLEVFILGLVPTPIDVDRRGGWRTRNGGAAAAQQSRGTVKRSSRRR